MSGLTPEQLPDYFDRLGKECEKAKGKKERKSIFKLKNISEIIEWRDLRPNMTKDFLNITSSLQITVPANKIPLISQEFNIVSDLISCFISGSSGYIQAEPLSLTNSTRKFKLCKEIDSQFSELAEQCLVLATYYSQLCRFIEDNRLLSVGRVNQALTSAMDITLIDYMTFIVEMENIHKKRPLRLQELWFHIQDIKGILEIMNNIASEINKLELRGALTLTYLHNQTPHLVASHSQRDLLKYLIKKAATPYMQSIQEWIFNGIIYDPFDEFMITEKPRNTSKDCQSSEYWEKRYQLRKSCIPEFLEPVVNEIFKSGAYLNVIRESVSCYDKKVNLAEMEVIKYSRTPSKYIDLIHKAYIYSSSYLLSHMMDEYQLMDRFVFMKKYFLVQQGDFVVQILDTCDEELSKFILDVIPSRLETLVDMTVKNVDDAVRNDLTIVLQPQDLSYQLSKILTVPSAEDHGGPKNLIINDKLSGYECFTLSINSPWPVSLVFNARIISCYQMLFRLLFYIKHIERLLSRVWILDQRLRKLPGSQMSQYAPAFALRHKMIYFIQSMQYYMMEEAIEPNWIEFQYQLKKVTSMSNSPDIAQVFPESNAKVNSIDDLLDIHKKFLDKCMSDCLLTNATLFSIFKSLLSVCKEFVTFIIIQVEDSINHMVISNINTFSKTISEMDRRFQEGYVRLLKSIAELAPLHDKASKIFEILQRANFNFYFSSMMEDSI